jgi:outer membrane protein TolC
MSEELQQLQQLNEKMDKLNINIERLIGLLATQNVQPTPPALPVPPVPTTGFPSAQGGMDIAAQVQAKIAEARAAAEKQVAQARLQVPQMPDAPLPNVSVSSEE